METGERLAAYLSGELPEDERAAIEVELAHDPTLRARLERLRRADRALAALPEVTPPEGFSDRLHTAVAEELAATDRTAAQRSRARRGRPWRALGAAAAAAAVVAVVGVGAGMLLDGGGADQTSQMAAPGVEEHAAGPQVVVTTTDNDYDDVELQRLAVGIDTSEVAPPGLEADEAAPLERELTSGLTDTKPFDTTAEHARRDAGAAAEDAPAPAAGSPAPEDVQRCLPQLLESASSPLVPVYVELARYRGEPAIVYAFAAEDPERGTYRRVEVWAVARSDCQVLSFAQYDRP